MSYAISEQQVVPPEALLQEEIYPTNSDRDPSLNPQPIGYYDNDVKSESSHSFNDNVLHRSRNSQESPYADSRQNVNFLSNPPASASNQLYRGYLDPNRQNYKPQYLTKAPVIEYNIPGHVDSNLNVNYPSVSHVNPHGYIDTSTRSYDNNFTYHSRVPDFLFTKDQNADNFRRFVEERRRLGRDRTSLNNDMPNNKVQSFHPRYSTHVNNHVYPTVSVSELYNPSTTRVSRSIGVGFDPDAFLRGFNVKSIRPESTGTVFSSSSQRINGSIDSQLKQDLRYHSSTEKQYDSLESIRLSKVASAYLNHHGITKNFDIISAHSTAFDRLSKNTKSNIDSKLKSAISSGIKSKNSIAFHHRSKNTKSNIDNKSESMINVGNKLENSKVFDRLSKNTKSNIDNKSKTMISVSDKSENSKVFDRLSKNTKPNIDSKSETTINVGNKSENSKAFDRVSKNTKPNIDSKSEATTSSAIKPETPHHRARRDVPPNPHLRPSLTPVLPPDSPQNPRTSTASVFILNNCGADAKCQPDIRTSLRLL